MSLVTCHECQAEVSDKADKCIKCGAPIGDLTTIQETGKGLKVQILLSALLFWGGVIFFVLHFKDATLMGSYSGIDDYAPDKYTVYAICIGLTLYIVTKFRIWWHHK